MENPRAYDVPNFVGGFSPFFRVPPFWYLFFALGVSKIPHPLVFQKIGKWVCKPLKKNPVVGVFKKKIIFKKIFGAGCPMCFPPFLRETHSETPKNNQITQKGEWDP